MPDKFSMNVVGAKEVKAALKEVDKTYMLGTRERMTRAALHIQRESQKEVPVLTGTLKNSAGTRVTGVGLFIEAIVFYTAAYAIYVHERTDLKHKAGKKAKFLEDPARREKAEVLNILRGEFP